MRIYNRSERAFIIDRSDAIEGCRFPTDEVGKNKAYIDPQAKVNITKEKAEKLLNDYPKELMLLDSKSTAAPRTSRKTGKSIAKKKR